jgi:hypothetical protein
MPVTSGGVPKQHIRPLGRRVGKSFRARASAARTAQASSEKVSAHLMMHVAAVLLCALRSGDRTVASSRFPGFWQPEANLFRHPLWRWCDRREAHQPPAGVSECRQGVRLRRSGTVQQWAHRFSPCRDRGVHCSDRTGGASSLSGSFFAMGVARGGRSPAGPVAQRISPRRRSTARLAQHRVRPRRNETYLFRNWEWLGRHR